MPTWWSGQNLGPSPTCLLMVSGVIDHSFPESDADVEVRVPKELISRFVKLCPTCRVRRGTSRNSPPECERSPEARTETQSPEATAAPNSRKNSMSHRQLMVNVTLPLQSAGFNTSSTFQQQNRWMTPLQPQQGDAGRVIPMSTSNAGNSHDSYNTIPPMSMNCTNATPPGLTFSSVNPFSRVTTPSSACSADSLSQATHGHGPAHHHYGAKATHHFL